MVRPKADVTAGAGVPRTPASGWIDSGVHHLPLRAYFEDTDLAGVVYYANYLKFMERGRSDLLRLLGVDQWATFQAGAGVYVVADLQIRYLRPARLGDDLQVETQCLDIGAASITMRQRVRRGEELLTDAQVRAGFLDSAGRPKRQPAEWVEKLRRFAETAG